MCKVIYEKFIIAVRAIIAADHNIGFAQGTCFLYDERKERESAEKLKYKFASLY
jgi:hypothetical protein